MAYADTSLILNAVLSDTIMRRDLECAFRPPEGHGKTYIRGPGPSRSRGPVAMGICGPEEALANWSPDQRFMALI